MKTRTIDQTVVIPAKPQEVYDAWIDPEEHSAMTGGAAGGEAKVGGEFLAWDGYITGTYLELVPGKKIVCDWQTSEWPEGAEPSRLELTFTPKDDGTEIHLIHSNIPPHDADYETGWHQSYWEPMREYFSSR
ncbi:SRPBCC domain-containing protein [Candidatus Berkelbacteria bacterium]|nr:SRPBCC domain-containing protein [Candidatus Berkelbacteria bacterium]